MRASRCTTLSRVRADFQAAGVRFKHGVTPGSPPGPARGHINAALRAEKFSTTPTNAAIWRSSQVKASSSPRGWLGKVALGAALGVSTFALVQSLHTGTVTAMARKLNLNSADGDWKETKGETLQPRKRRL